MERRVMLSGRSAWPSLWPLWLLSLSGLTKGIQAVPTGGSPRCEPITAPMCSQGLPYNTTAMPNSFHHESQDEATLEVHQFWPLVEINCSPVLRTFLCSIYFPVCSSQGVSVPPCRGLCHSAWEGCHGIMKAYGFSWPEKLNCNWFPTATEELCIGSTHNDLNTVIIHPAPDQPSATITTAPQVTVDGTATSPSPATLCEAITVPLCLGLSYDQTFLPNILQHQTQEQVAAEMLLLQAVIETQCSPHLRLLLCSIFTPPCILSERERLPCRGLCVSARHGCEGLMNQFGIQWPSSLECGMLPDESHEGCVGSNITSMENRTQVINEEIPENQTVYSSEASPISKSGSGKSICENITVPMCQNLPYTTVFPNTFNHTTQEHAALEIHQFWPLVEMTCSAHLHLFLCSLYIPLCTVLEKAIPPCRSLCFSAKAGCEASLETYRLTWPMNCHKLPAGGLCVSGNITNSHGVSEGETVTLLVPNESQSSTATPSVTHVQESVGEQCEYTAFPLCRIFYNTTLMPNLLHQRSQEEAIEELRQFSPLVEAQCSPDLQLFLCTIYVPPCIMERPLLPCRSLCLSIREGCEELMSKFGFQWPESLDCSIFPAEPRIEACVDSSFPLSLIADEVSTTYDTSIVLSTVTSTTTTAPNIADVITTQNSVGSCKHITTPICQDIPYNTTVLPNLMNQSNQEEAALEVQQFFPLIKLQCSPDILLFLCSVYVPPCTILERALPPCHRLCLSAKTGCEPLMNKFGFLWPDSLDCDKVAADPQDQLCIDSISFRSVMDEESTTINSTISDIITSSTIPSLASTVSPTKITNIIQAQNPSGKCEHITVPLCQEIPYNTTVLPNMFNHSTQDDAAMEVHQFFPLVKVQCSLDLQLFLCSVYLPPCILLERPLLPCRNLCLSAKKGCEPIMVKFGFSWPDSLDCDKISADPRDQLCIDSVLFRSTVDEESSNVNSTVSDIITSPKTPSLTQTISPTKITNIIQTQNPEGTCEHITVPLCQNIPYNTTVLPNMLNHSNQDDAGLELHQFFPLVKMQCSLDIQLFLCTAYLPPCTLLERPLLPCRSLCLSAKRGCEPILVKFGFPWPDSLDCDKISADPRDQLCIDSVSFRSIVDEESSNVNSTVSDIITSPKTPSLTPTVSPTNITNIVQTQNPGGTCEHITVPLCQDIPYNTTVLPNMLNHSTQDDAGLELHQFFPLVKIQCSVDIQLFLCSAYLPPCTLLERPLLPCRSLCLSAKRGCEPLMVKFGFSWPDSLDCDKISVDPRHQVCIDSASSRSAVGEERPTPTADIISL